MASFNLSTQNATCEINLPRYRNGAVQVTLAAAADPAAVVVVEVNGYADEWIAIGLYNPVAQANVSQIQGPSTTAWSDIPAYYAVRARRTDATVASCPGAIEFIEG